MPDPAITTTSDDTARPVPPRYWWAKRILLAIGVVVLLLVVLRWWWGWEAQRRLDALIAEYRAAGQPVTVEDFQVPAVPDGENAAHFLMQAAAALVPPAVETKAHREFIEGLYGHPDLVGENADDVGRWVEANAEVFSLVDTVREKESR